MRLGEIDRGSRGQEVQVLQHLLNTRHNPRPPLELDGVFGPMTERAVRSYQQDNRLGIDGVVGAETWRSLGASATALPERSPPAPTSRTATAEPTRAVTAPSVRQLPIGNAPVSRGIAAAAASVAAPARAMVPAARPAPRRSPQIEPPGTAIGAPWMRIALAEAGVSEVRGSQHNPRIIEYHAATGLAAKQDEVAWCASFVNWCLREAGLRGNNSARAKDFGTWGRGLETPRYGCIVHLHRAPRGVDQRTGSSSGNHVAFFVRQTATHITLLGGNQGNRVRESNYPLNHYRVMAMRWPSDR